jgi:hypothetical protein
MLLCCHLIHDFCWSTRRGPFISSCHLILAAVLILVICLCQSMMQCSVNFTWHCTGASSLSFSALSPSPDGYTAAVSGISQSPRSSAPPKVLNSTPCSSPRAGGMRLPQELANARMLKALQNVQARQILTSAQSQWLHQLSNGHQPRSPTSIPVQLAAAHDPFSSPGPTSVPHSALSFILLHYHMIFMGKPVFPHKHCSRLLDRQC